MIKAASKFLFVLVAFAAVAPLRAQTTSADITLASDEAVRRQADTLMLRQKLVEAEGAQQRNELVPAAKLYEDCYSLVQKIGTGVESEAAATDNGLTTVLLQLARLAQKQHDYRTADERVRRVLVIEPRNQAALVFKSQNDGLLAAQIGHVPSDELLAQVPTWRTNQIHVAILVQDGKLLYEAGKLDEAEAKLELAYKEDPQNVAAFQYLQLIREKRTADAMRKNDLDARTASLQIEEAWRVPLRKEAIQLPNAYARTNLVWTSKGRQGIISKLDRIRIDSVKYDGLPLGEVINNLSELTRSRDPDKLGINFFLNRENPTTTPTGPGAVDPTTGLPVPALGAEPVDVASVTIKITPALSNVRLADLLDAITKASDKPIKYSIEDYAVVFSLKPPETTPMYTRIFHIDPNTFRQGLESVQALVFGNITTSSGGGGGSSGGGGSGSEVGAILPQVNVPPVIATSGGGGGGGGGAGSSAGLRYVTRTNTLDAESVMVRNFFTAAGVDFNPTKPDNIGKSIFFNDRRGTLMVHSTLADLDIIGAALETLNQAPPEVNIKTKFAQISQNDSSALGFDWFLGNVLLGNGSVAGSGGSQPIYNSPITTANPSGIFPTAPPVTANPAPAGNVTSGLRQLLPDGTAVPSVASFTGLLTDPQFKVAINALEQRDGVELLNAPEITTESGRQAQVQVVDLQTIVTGVSTGNNSQNNSSSTPGGTGTLIQQVAIQVNYNTQILPFGPVLDVIPSVSADEFSIQMTIIPTVTDFVGYDNPGGFVPSTAVGTLSLQAVLPLPHLRVRQLTTSAIVWDAQTIVLGGLISSQDSKIKDKVPMLGDLPLVGRLFQSQSEQKTKENLMIFVTPTIINPDGSRYHSDDEMPFAQNSIPAQRPIQQ